MRAAAALGVRRPRLPALDSRRIRLVLAGRRARLSLTAGVVLLALLGGGWLWLRDSSLVSVEHVTVSGVNGPDARAIRRALIAAAHGMTTLDVNTGQLRTAISPFPEVKSLSVSASFPHRLRIRVVEQLPVAIVVIGTRREAVSADGTLLRRFAAGAVLPTITLPVLPGGTRLIGASHLKEVEALGAAPPALLPKIARISMTPGVGLVAQLRAGPTIYLGDSSQMRMKWLAASEVLADPGSAGASYVDVTDPARPAAGAGSDSATGAGSAAAGGASAAGPGAAGAGASGAP